MFILNLTIILAGWYSNFIKVIVVEPVFFGLLAALVMFLMAITTLSFLTFILLGRWLCIIRSLGLSKQRGSQ